jgi:hypothetical protein
MKVITTITVCCVLVWSMISPTYGQQPQIPPLQACNQTQVKANATVKIDTRADATHSGTFRIIVRTDVMECHPTAPNGGYPSGTIILVGISMTDSFIQGDLVSTSIEQLTSTGNDSPTAYLNGRCNAAEVSGCRFWIMLADNRHEQFETPDVVSFLVFDGTGQRKAYGTGPVVDGDVFVFPTPN